MAFVDFYGLVQLCVCESTSAMNYWVVTLSLPFAEPFCYFPNIISYTCIFNVSLKHLNPAVFQAVMHVVLKKLYCLWSFALRDSSSRSGMAGSWGGCIWHNFWVFLLMLMLTCKDCYCSIHWLHVWFSWYHLFQQLPVISPVDINGAVLGSVFSCDSRSITSIIGLWEMCVGSVEVLRRLCPRRPFDDATWMRNG
jgi:hypothetical protein